MKKDIIKRQLLTYKILLQANEILNTSLIILVKMQTFEMLFVILEFLRNYPNGEDKYIRRKCYI